MIINTEQLQIDDADIHEVDGAKLHAVCLTHMSRFMVEPTAEQAALVAAMLEALGRHPQRFDPGCGCDPYAQARAVWLRVVAHIEQTETDTASAAKPAASLHLH